MASKSKLRLFLCSTFPEARLIEADATDVDYGSGASRKGHFPSLTFLHFLSEVCCSKSRGSSMSNVIIFDLLEASFRPPPSQVLQVIFIVFWTGRAGQVGAGGSEAGSGGSRVGGLVRQVAGRGSRGRRP